MFAKAALLLTVSALLPASLNAQAEGVAEVNGVALPYDVHGDGPALVLIHGWAVSRAYWDGDIEPLAQHFRVIRYDRRGYGEATGRADPTADAADLAALLQEVGISQAHLIGHSQGANVALTFALRYPEMTHRVILFGSGPPEGLELPPSAEFPPVEEWMEIGHRLGVDSMKVALMMWAGAAFGDDPALIGDRAARLLEPYNGLDLLDPAPPSGLADVATAAELAQVKAPTLVIFGEHDMVMVHATAEVLVRDMPDARKLIIPRAGHVANWVQPERFMAEVLRFLNE